MRHEVVFLIILTLAAAPIIVATAVHELARNDATAYSPPLVFALFALAFPYVVCAIGYLTYDEHSTPMVLSALLSVFTLPPTIMFLYRCAVAAEGTPLQHWAGGALAMGLFYGGLLIWVISNIFVQH